MADCDGVGSSGEPNTCKHFKVQTGDQMTACRKKGLSPDLGNNENIYGVLQKLPGCNKITYTEAEAKAAAAEKCSDADAPPVAGGSSTSKSSSSLGSSTSTRSSSSSSKPASSTVPVPTSTKPASMTTSRSTTNAAPTAPTASSCKATVTVTVTKTAYRTPLNRYVPSVDLLQEMLTDHAALLDCIRLRQLALPHWVVFHFSLL